MPIVEYWVDSPTLRESITRAPDVSITFEEQYSISGTIHLVFWAETDEYGAFEKALEADPTVTDVRQLAETATRRLYRVRFTEEGHRTSTFPMRRELDIQFLDGAVRDDGWKIRMRVPDREALSMFRTAYEERGLSFQLESLYDESEAENVTDSLITDAQRAALVKAYEAGYFDVPRRAELDDIAPEFGISSQSLSERIRRGMETLIESSLLGK